MQQFSIPYAFAEKYVRFTKPEYLQVYLYLKYKTAIEDGFPKAEQIAKELDMTQERIIFILDYWVSRDELIYDEQGYHFPAENEKQEKERSVSTIKRRRVSRPSYTMKEIDAAAACNKAVSGLFYQAETVLHKILTASDMEMLYSFMDWLGLPVEVITMLLSYGAKKGKTNRRYLETVAIDWAERGIDTFEAAEAHVMALEEMDSAERKVRTILGIYDRALTATERKYIRLWCVEMTLSPELIALAYDRTVANTGKLSWAYMNKILQNWIDEGLSTPQEILDREASAIQKSKPESKKDLPRKSKFHNYIDTNQTDYTSLEEQILDMMLEQEG